MLPEVNLFLATSWLCGVGWSVWGFRMDCSCLPVRPLLQDDVLIFITKKSFSLRYALLNLHKQRNKGVTAPAAQLHLNLCRCSFHNNGKWDAKQFEIAFLCIKVTKTESEPSMPLLWLQLELLQEAAGSLIEELMAAATCTLKTVTILAFTAVSREQENSPTTPGKRLLFTQNVTKVVDLARKKLNWQPSGRMNDLR